jgi:hypothetical protein
MHAQSISSAVGAESRFLWRGSPPVGCNTRSCPVSMNLVQSQHALLACFSAGSCRRWRRCARLSLEANKLRFDDPVQAGRRCSTFPGCADTITAQSCAALLDALISNKVAMWFGESCSTRSDQQRQRSPGSGQRRRWQRLSGGAFTSVAKNEKKRPS